ncbi:MAG: RNA-binding S4 domain-containing protein [Myxococcota bacterium]
MEHTEDGQPFIRLDQFLKHKSMVATGGQAKLLIQGGQVQVNGEVETRRGRKLRQGDTVSLEGRTATVSLG